MTTNITRGPEDTEGWGAYRKLIVDTLRRLDDYITDLKEEQSAQQSRIQNLENRPTESRLEKIEKDIVTLKDDVASAKTNDSNDEVRRHTITAVGGAIWGIIVIIIATWINVHFFH